MGRLRDCDREVSTLLQTVVDGPVLLAPYLKRGPRFLPIQNRGPGPERPTLSPGLASWHCCNERHPQPMHCVRPALRRSSSAMRSSTRLVQPADSFAQSDRSGTRLWGSFESSTPISSSDRPIFCANTMKAMRRRTARG